MLKPRLFTKTYLFNKLSHFYNPAEEGSENIREIKKIMVITSISTFPTIFYILSSKPHFLHFPYPVSLVKSKCSLFDKDINRLASTND